MTRESDEPLIPLDYREEQIAMLLGRGWSYKRISQEVGLQRCTIAAYVGSAADKLPNPDGLTPQMVVVLWAAHRRWRQERDRPAA